MYDVAVLVPPVWGNLLHLGFRTWVNGLGGLSWTAPDGIAGGSTGNFPARCAAGPFHIAMVAVSNNLVGREMNALKSFQNTFVRFVVLSAAPLGLALWLVAPMLTKGFLLGVAAGCAALIVKLQQARTIIRRPGRRPRVSFLVGGFSMVIYALAFYAAYRTGPDRFLAGAGVFTGLLLVQGVIMTIGITSWDLRKVGTVGMPSSKTCSGRDL